MSGRRVGSGSAGAAGGGTTSFSAPLAGTVAASLSAAGAVGGVGVPESSGVTAPGMGAGSAAAGFSTVRLGGMLPFTGSLSTVDDSGRSLFNGRLTTGALGRAGAIATVGAVSQQAVEAVGTYESARTVG